MRYSFDEEQHIHTLDGKSLSGTSSIVGVLNKPGLTWWASGKALEPLGWTPTKEVKSKRGICAVAKLGEIKKMHGKEYLELLDKCYHNHKDSLEKSADKGIDLHAELERYINSVMNPKYLVLEPFNERIKPFIEWSEKNVKRFLWSEAHCYDDSPDMWVGGIFDFMAELNTGELILGDFKSSPKPYLSQWLQAGGYVLQIEKNGIFDKDGNLLGKIDKPIEKLVIVPFGAKEVVPVFNTIPIGDLKINFKNAVGLYRLTKDWDENG